MSIKQEKKPFTNRCLDCKFKFTSKSRIYYCCNKQDRFCVICSRKVCQKCKKQRLKRLNIPCIKCDNFVEEDEAFYDIKTDKYYCPKCLSDLYIFHYEHMVKSQKDPKDCIIKLNQVSQYPISDFFAYFTKICFCCLKPFNDNSFEMKYGARICSNCLQMNFDLAQPKLIICIECNGYIHDAHEISFEISGTEVLCIYCSLDEAKCYDAHQKQAEAQLNKESKLTTKSKLSSKSSLKNGQLFSAVQLSKIKSSGMKNEELKMLKVISRESIEIQQKDLLIEIILNPLKQQCFRCKSFLPKQKLLRSKQQSGVYLCFMCSKQNKPLKDQEDNPLLSTQKSINSMNKLAQTRIKSPISQRTITSPKKIFAQSSRCVQCKANYANYKSQKGFLCFECSKNVKK